MPRYKLTIEYDGTGISGWQRQDDMPSVQQYVEEAISAYYGTKERMVIQCAGRTDAGVHAYGQVVHVDLPEERDCYSIQQGINFHLATPQIVIREAEKVSDEFNARFDAKKRTYRYRILNRRAPLALDRFTAWQVGEELDAQAMHEAAQLLVGTHDFTSFRDSQCQSKSPVKTIDSIRITRSGDEIITELQAKSFLHHQVRIIMGSLKRIGTGKWTSSDLKAALDAKDRAAAGETAPPQGLVFMKVEY